MKLGILETGKPPKDLEHFPDYPAMFRALLGEDAYDYRTYAVAAGEFPSDPVECRAYIVTGSACGAYDDLPWIGRLGGFLRNTTGRAALVGICFGHQIMAQAFGGKVVKSPHGWGVGLHSYDVLALHPFLDGAETITLVASHQDQVVEIPPGADVIAASEFSPTGMLLYRDFPAISLQLHPEFDHEFAAALMESHRRNGLPGDLADRAVASLAVPYDRKRAGGWIKAFLAQAIP